MTGCYPVRNSLMFNHLPHARTGISAQEITLAQQLKKARYATAIIGKWHLGDAPPFLPTRHGFDPYFGLPYSNDMWPFHPQDRADTGRRSPADGGPCACRNDRLLTGRAKTIP